MSCPILLQYHKADMCVLGGGGYMNSLFTQVIGEGLEEKWWLILFNTMTCKEFSPTFSVQLT